MLAIRLAVEPDTSGVIALPVRAAADDGRAELLAPLPGLPDEVIGEAAALLDQVEHSGAAGVLYDLPRPLRTPVRLLLVGVGAADESGWRSAGAAIVRAAATETCITIVTPVDVSPAAVRGLAEGLWLGSYRYRAGDGSPAGRPPADGPPADPTGLAEVLVAVTEPDRHQAALAAAQVTAESTRFARDLTNTPSSVKDPAWFADQVGTAATGTGLSVTVREPEQLAAEGFGGILAVGKGSTQGARLVEVGWHPAGATRHVVLVGKGITFDTGGISIKPRDGMKLMRKDMGGAAAVVAATIGAARLNLPVRVTALAPLAENMVSGSAFRPGDIVTHFGGRTSESTNTDAEGRLVVADALAYAVERLAPDLLIDLATLTGANAVALGKRTAALYSENDDLAESVIGAAADAGELAWRMPLVGDYVEYLGSDLADYYSAPAGGAGSVTAALYLREFTGDLRDRWLHIDMSAPSWADSDDRELAKGATGWGVRTLLRWLAGLD